ncbi:Uncharacterized protein YP598_1122 [Yersinia pseudotuberculosis]|uniref:Uncharacterized protein n=1 Tax=Yersinia pseudotuberculosis serotype O:1b (strain IP 31758) TaxID=349747 RepID=A0A0U1QUI4_YERP3|nr:hypothetical protein YpsIP31758_1097 [Yersinia pseudotuberculosis IP 31758]UFA60745.1 Uncharacterized protein YP598_1122 [Yersinia pseudotuberculosis]
MIDNHYYLEKGRCSTVSEVGSVFFKKNAEGDDFLSFDQ